MCLKKTEYYTQHNIEQKIIGLVLAIKANSHRTDKPQQVGRWI